MRNISGGCERDDSISNAVAAPNPYKNNEIRIVAGPSAEAFGASLPRSLHCAAQKALRSGRDDDNIGMWWRWYRVH